MAGKTFLAFPAHAHLQFSVSGKRPMTTVPQFLGATALKTIWFLFTTSSIPDLSHLISLSKLHFIYSEVICDHHLCWALFESFTFPLGLLEDRGCAKPQKFRYRNIFSISKLELGCYDSKFIAHFLVIIRIITD